MSLHATLTDSQRAIFLSELAEHGLETRAAKSAGSSLTTIRRHAQTDPDFMIQIELAKEEAADHLEAEARRRAISGIEKPVTFQGVITDTYKEYSDSLLAKLLTGRRRSVFGDKREITGAGGAPVQIVVQQFADDAPADADQSAHQPAQAQSHQEVNPDEFSF